MKTRIWARLVSFIGRWGGGLSRGVKQSANRGKKLFTDYDVKDADLSS